MAGEKMDALEEQELRLDVVSLNWEGRVIRWAEERNLIDGSNPIRQMEKLAEEMDELLRGIVNDDSKEIADAIGDCCVVLCIIAAQRGLSFDACLEWAWGQIKDRKGKMVNGIFVKDESSKEATSTATGSTHDAPCGCEPGRCGNSR